MNSLQEYWELFSKETTFSGVITLLVLVIFSWGCVVAGGERHNNIKGEIIATAKVMGTILLLFVVLPTLFWVAIMGK